MTLAEIRLYQDKTVTLTLVDGEVATVKIIFVDTEYEDVVVDIVSTNRPGNYRHVGASYTIAVVDVVSVQEVSLEN